MEFLIGETLDVVGKIMIAFTVLMVHHRFRKEHKVDEKVFKAMRREQIIGLLGIALIVIGYFLRLPSFL
ncbi:hypothetical protein IIA94_02970 [Patescibacteria group bacterium]|nr:hypothetical protein [Patescibacteria group bacterium]